MTVKFKFGMDVKTWSERIGVCEYDTYKYLREEMVRAQYDITKRMETLHRQAFPNTGTGIKIGINPSTGRMVKSLYRDGVTWGKVITGKLWSFYGYQLSQTMITSNGRSLPYAQPQLYGSNTAAIKLKPKTTLTSFYKRSNSYVRSAYENAGTKALEKAIRHSGVSE